jgi:hypothetical protein
MWWESAQNEMILCRPRIEEFVQMGLMPIKQEDRWCFCTQFLTSTNDVRSNDVAEIGAENCASDKRFWTGLASCFGEVGALSSIRVVCPTFGNEAWASTSPASEMAQRAVTK